MRDKHFSLKLLSILFFEATERFGFYGLQGLLLNYSLFSLGIKEGNANLIAASFSGLAFASTLIGGISGLSPSAARRNVVTGACLQMVALACLALFHPQKSGFLAALAAVALANGLTRPNVASMIRSLLQPGERSDNLFTLYAFAVNLGASTAFLTLPWIAHHFGWGASFGLCALCVAAGLSGMLLTDFRIPSEEQTSSTHISGNIFTMLAGGIIAFGALYAIMNNPSLGQHIFAIISFCLPLLWILLASRCNQTERKSLIMALVLILQAMFYAVFDEQTTSSMILFALHDVSPDFTIAGITIAHLSGAQFVSINAGLTMFFSPLLVSTYKYLDKNSMNPPLHFKYLVGSLFIVLSFGLLAWNVSHQTSALMSPWTFAASYALISIAGLLMNSLGLAVIAEYIPSRFNSLATALFFLSIGTAMYGGGFLANRLALARLSPALSPEQVVGVFGHLFMILTAIALAGTIILATTQPFFRKILANIEKERPHIKKASL